MIAIAEALILRNELTDIDVNEILARVESSNPFISSEKEEAWPMLGFVPRALPVATNGRRNGNGRSNGNGKSPAKDPEPVIVPASSQPPAEPTAPSAELHDEPAEESERQE